MILLYEHECLQASKRSSLTSPFNLKEKRKCILGWVIFCSDLKSIWACVSNGMSIFNSLVFSIYRRIYGRLSKICFDLYIFRLAWYQNEYRKIEMDLYNCWSSHTYWFLYTYLFVFVFLKLSASERIIHDKGCYIYACTILKLIYRMMHKV